MVQRIHCGATDRVLMPDGRGDAARSQKTPFSETLAIATSALSSAHRLTANRRTPFSPRAHHKLSIWCWAPRYSRWPRPHELGELHDFYACLTRRYRSRLAI